ncbi:GDP-mannose-dependent alpha-(1-6)-phosphatidylinositol dimannoside mannosyltransferase [Nocardioides szechwanensis]|uniref:Alpha-1,6-mannosyltransferase n=1 Tax=Nocardioides szechwanensis TaxID=1005944 RepID=A0A1G9Z0P4_9ACTN|nr:glycosyltransferase [Nocardioides szechwanensis]GEP33772.1 GDP-mannose-dependent alpha-(1-6)-phosphatidylinositol dimannoside mannosyltransferase [Nocardioides szechwanensis]SDN14850.1 alpha-1,6-mannosyltransferase [Nocardioides szechwanensis]
MRIAQLANFIGPASGGMKHAVDALGRGYVAAGVERLLVIPGPVDAVTATEHGDVVQVRAPRVGSGYRLILEPWRVIEVLEEFRPTSVELSDKLTLLPVARWARRRGVGTVLISHERLDDMFAMRTGLDTSAKASIKLLNRILVRSFDTVVVTSRYAEAEFRQVADSAGCPVSRVPLGVDLETFRPYVAPAADGVLRLAHVGRLSREKSPHLAVATAVELHRRGVPVSMDVYGDGPHRDELVALAAGAPVRFHGFVESRVELSRQVAAADVSLSVCPGETFGLAVLEALASGTPVVTADRGGARELVDVRSGGWAAPEAGALADAVLEVAGRSVPVRRAAARQRAEQFPWSRSIDRMLDVHVEVSGGLLRLPA